MVLGGNPPAARANSALELERTSNGGTRRVGLWSRTDHRVFGICDEAIL